MNNKDTILSHLSAAEVALGKAASNSVGDVELYRWLRRLQDDVIDAANLVKTDEPNS